LSRKIKRASYLTEENIETSLDDLRYGHGRLFLLLSLLYNDQNWGSTPHQIDHIIPTSRVNRRTLQAAGASSTQIDMMLAAVDRPGNLEILTASENNEKTNQPFEDWIRTRDDSFLGRHHIPGEESLWSIMMLPKFVAERERRIKQRLASLRIFNHEN
jgi:5-methylcytosine-specific restriction endonuclease McrA